MAMTIKLLGQYNNGNFAVSIFRDGTKIRKNDLDFFDAEFPECIDLKITDYCDAGCIFCHENSTRQGFHGKLDYDFIDTLKPYTELAIGGGNPLDHPQIIEFLEYLKSKNIIANLTVNQIHFEKQQTLIKEIARKGLVYGLGVSLVKPTDKFLELVKEYNNVIIHVINGIITKEYLEKMFDRNLKILILGYKYLRRGKDYYSEKVEEGKSMLYDLLPSIRERFPIISFDNLALNQLEVKRLMSEEDWNNFYMGDDGKFTMYIDAVKGEFSKSSTTEKRYAITSDIVDMFHVVKNNF